MLFQYLYLKFKIGTRMILKYSLLYFPTWKSNWCNNRPTGARLAPKPNTNPPPSFRESWRRDPRCSASSPKLLTPPPTLQTHNNNHHVSLRVKDSLHRAIGQFSSAPSRRPVLMPYRTTKTPAGSPWKSNYPPNYSYAAIPTPPNL